MKNFLLFIFTCLFLLVISEFVLRSTDYQALLFRAPITVEKDPNSQFYVFDSDLGFKIQKNATSNIRAFPFDGISYIPKSNNLGCYDDNLYQERAGNFGLFIGDSFTFGTHRKEHGWPSLVETQTDYTILACGVDSYGTKQELLWTKAILNELSHKPDFILLQYYVGNDMFDDYIHPAVIAYQGQKISRVDLAKTNFNTGEIVARDQSQISTQFNAEIDNQPSALARHSVLYGLIEAIIIGRNSASVLIPKRTSSSHSPSFITFDKDNRSWLINAWKMHLENLLAFKHMCNEQGIPLFVVLVPSNDQVYPFLLSNEEKNIIDLLQPNRIVAEYLTNNNILFYDSLEDLRNYADQTPRLFLDPSKDLYHKVDGHFSLLGERIFSYLVTKFLSEKKVLKNSDVTAKKANEELSALKMRISTPNTLSITTYKPKIISYGPKIIEENQIKDSPQIAFWVKLESVTPYMQILFNNQIITPVIDLKSNVLTFEIPSIHFSFKKSYEIYLYDRTNGVMADKMILERK